MPRKIAVEIVGDSSSLERAFARSARSATTFNQNVTRAGASGRSAFGALARNVALASAAFLGATGFVGVVKASVDEASSLNEELSRSSRVFGDSARGIEAWSQTAAESFGLSQRAALEATGNFGTMFHTIGLGEREAAKMSQRLAELGADMASFSNQTPEDMLLRLRSGLAGEAEPLRRFGVLLSEARVQQEAYATGIAKSGDKLTEQQKVLARYSLILKDTAVQHGDFARTSDQLANRQRILSAQIGNLQARLGQALLPTVLRIVQSMTDWLGKTENQQRVQRDFNAALSTAQSIAGSFAAVLRVLVPIVREATAAVGGLRNAILLLLAAMTLSKLRAFTGEVTLMSVATKDLSRGLAVMEAAAVLRFGRVGAAAARLASALVLLRNPITIVVGIELLRGGQELKTIRQGLSELVADARSGDWGAFFFGRGNDAMAEFKSSLQAVEARVSRLPAATQDSIRTFIANLSISPSDDLPAWLDAVNAKIDTFTAGAARASASIEGVRSSIEANLARTENFGAGNLTPTTVAGGGAGGATAAQRNAWWDAVIGRRIDRTADMRNLQQQLVEYRTIAALIRERIAITKDVTRRLNLGDLLHDVQQRQQDTIDSIRAQTQQTREAAAALAEQQAENRRLARNARQYQALGLTATGEERAPGIRALRQQLASVRDFVKGTSLNTPALRRRLAGVGKVLSESIVGRDLRLKVREILNDIDQDLQRFSGRIIRRRKINADAFVAALGLDLTHDQLRRIQRYLSTVGPGMTLPGLQSGQYAAAGGIQVGSVNLYGVQDMAHFETELTKRASRRPKVRRGAR